jgi:hypothetical protein
MGNKKLWLESFITLLLDDPEFGLEIRKKLRDMKI